MSDKIQPEYADEHRPSVREKKKGRLPSSHEFGDKPRALQKQHDAVDWKPGTTSVVPAPASH